MRRSAFNKPCFPVRLPLFPDLQYTACASPVKKSAVSGAHYLETETGLPLGTRERSFSERTIEMTAGSRLIFYSDGVTEAMNSSLEEYGETRLRAHAANPSASVESLLNEVRAFVDGHSASDDITVVMVQACG